MIFPSDVAYNKNVLATNSEDAFGPEVGWLGGFASGAWPSANLAIYIPIRVATRVLGVKMFVQNFATINGNLDLGIFDSQGNSIVTKGSTAQSGATSIQTLDITDTTFGPGLYYLGMSTNSTTATYGRIAPAAEILRGMGVYTQTTAFPLPTTTATFTGTTTAYLPYIGLATNTVI